MFIKWRALNLPWACRRQRYQTCRKSQCCSSSWRSPGWPQVSSSTSRCPSAPAECMKACNHSSDRHWTSQLDRPSTRACHCQRLGLRRRPSCRHHSDGTHPDKSAWRLTHPLSQWAEATHRCNPGCHSFPALYHSHQSPSSQNWCWIFSEHWLSLSPCPNSYSQSVAHPEVQCRLKFYLSSGRQSLRHPRLVCQQRKLPLCRRPLSPRYCKWMRDQLSYRAEKGQPTLLSCQHIQGCLDRYHFASICTLARL